MPNGVSQTGSQAIRQEKKISQTLFIARRTGLLNIESLLTERIEELRLLKKFISSDMVDIAALQQMLKQEKELGSELDKKYSMSFQEMKSRIEATRRRI